MGFWNKVKEFFEVKKPFRDEDYASKSGASISFWVDLAISLPLCYLFATRVLPNKLQLLAQGYEAGGATQFVIETYIELLVAVIFMAGILWAPFILAFLVLIVLCLPIASVVRSKSVWLSRACRECVAQ